MWVIVPFLPFHLLSTPEPQFVVTGSIDVAVLQTSTAGRVCELFVLFVTLLIIRHILTCVVIWQIDRIAFVHAFGWDDDGITEFFRRCSTSLCRQKPRMELDPSPFPGGFLWGGYCALLNCFVSAFCLIRATDVIIFVWLITRLLINRFQFCTPLARDVPNMAQKENAKTPPTNPPQMSVPTPAVVTTTATNPSTISQRPRTMTKPAVGSSMNNAVSGDKQDDARGAATAGWAASWSKLLWEKWRWGALIALAVLVSRISSSVWGMEEKVIMPIIYEFGLF